MTEFLVRAARPLDSAGFARVLERLHGRALEANVRAAVGANLLRILSSPGQAVLVAESSASNAGEPELLGFVTMHSHWGLFDDAPTGVIDRLHWTPPPPVGDQRGVDRAVDGETDSETDGEIADGMSAEGGDPSRRGLAVAGALLEQAFGALAAIGCADVEFAPTDDTHVPEELLERLGLRVVRAGRRRVALR